MQLVCVREGRAGYHVGDVVTVSDDIDAFDTNYFVVGVPAVVDSAKQAKIENDLAELDKQKSLVETEAVPPEADSVVKPAVNKE